MRQWVFNICMAVLVSACAPMQNKQEQVLSENKQVQERDGVRTDDEIQAVFDSHKSELYRIYQQALRNDPTLAGSIQLRVVVEPSGTVAECTLLKSTLKNPVMGRRIMEQVRHFNFGAKSTERLDIFTYPIDFIPR